MKNENPSEKITKLMMLSKDALAGMICSKDNEIIRLNNILSHLEAKAQNFQKVEHSDKSKEINRLNKLIDTLKQGNQKLINTIAYQAMLLSGELKR